MNSEGFSGVVFRALSRSLRRSIISALRGSDRQFSDLMRTCGLDPDHDSGLFVYHLSQLIDLGLVERVGEGYRLTDFGERISELVSTVERESAFLIERIPKEKKEVTEVKGDISIEWFEFDKMVQQGILYETEEDFVPKMSQEQRRIYEVAKQWPKANKYLVALKDERPMAHLRIELKYHITAECEKARRPVRAVKAVEPHLEIEDLGLRTTEAVDREKAVTALLEIVEDEGRDIGVKKIWVYQVNADDKAVVSALKERGFQRFATTYIMTKEL